MSLARDVLRRSIQARDRGRAQLVKEEEKRKQHSKVSARQDWRDIKRYMPDAGPHGRATEMARRGYNRARQEGIDRGRRTMAAEEADRVERVTAMRNRKKAMTGVRHEKEQKSVKSYHAGSSESIKVKAKSGTKSSTKKKSGE